LKQNPPTSTTTGRHAELAARIFLEQHQLIHCDSNYRHRGGEIDLIMKERDQHLIFVEVRLRSNPHYGSGAESVTSSKQHRIAQTALHYLQCHPQYQQYEMRFDVLSATMKQGQYHFEWIKEAFWPGES